MLAAGDFAGERTGWPSVTLGGDARPIVRSRKVADLFSLARLMKSVRLWRLTVYLSGGDGMIFLNVCVSGLNR